MKTEELLPCPFCGHSEVTYDTDEDAVYCGGCGLVTSPFMCPAGATVHNQWNTRTTRWQPIETAPKDGSVVLIWNESVHIAWYDEEQDAWVDVDSPECTALLASHWQPLPENP